MNPEAVPDALRDRDQWICWRTECRECSERLEPTTKTCPECGEKATKKPIDPGSGGFASSTNPETWATLAEASDYNADNPDTDGIGFVFDANGLVAGVDLDDCRDPETGEIAEWAADLIDRLDSFTEVSPSGTGLHIYAFGFVPDGGNREPVGDGELEMYDSGRYFTVTGQHFDGTPEAVEQRSETLTEIHAEYIDAEEADEPDAAGETEVAKSDGKLSYTNEFGDSLEEIREQDDKLDRLLNRLNPGGYGGDTSRADMAAASKLWFWRFDERQISKILRTYRSREKVRERDDYVRMTIGAAKGGERYEPAKADGGAEATSSGDAQMPDLGEATWEDVQMLFDSDAKGSTTEAYNMATEVLCRDYTFVAVRETGAIYYFDPSKGYYVRKGETFIKELLNEHLGNRVNVNRVRNIREQVVARNYVAVDDFEPPEGKLCVENGVLDLETRELEDHSPDYYFTSRLQSPYDPGTEAERWPEFLEETVAIEGDAKKLEEFMGYTLEVWHHSREKNLFIVGPSRSGKSTFAEVISALFGTVPTVTNLTPQQIADTQFDAASLKEAMLNAVNDINATKIEDTGTLKRVFSGEPLKLERKHEDAHFGAPKAKHLFTANWLPRIVGQDEAFFRRLLVVEFPNQIPESEKDTELADKLKAELPGILNRALDARDRLEEQGRFTNDRDMTKTRQMWDSWQDAHKRFLYTQFRITGDSEDTVDRKAYYQAYKEYAARENYEIKPQQSVTKSLKYVPEIAVPSEDDYRGLQWLDVDAAEETEVSQLSLADTQQERLSVVRGIIDDLAAESRGADRESVVETAAERGYEAEAVERSIDKMLNQGIAYEPATGELQLT